MVDIFDRLAQMEGFTPSDLSQFLSQIRNYSPSEIGAIFGYLLGRQHGSDAAALVQALRELQPQRKIPSMAGQPTVSMVGTGGGPSTFNITTTASFVVAAAGPLVVKMGSRAWRSKSGSVDVATELGVLPARLPWEAVLQVAKEVGIVFVPTSYYPPVLARLAHMVTVESFRRIAGYVNILGPLISPVNVDHRFIGARSVDCMEMLADACQQTGDVPTTFFAAEDGLDEVSTTAPTRVLDVDASGATESDTIDPAELQIESPTLDALAGFEPTKAAECCQCILDGRGTRAQTDIVALNAAAILQYLGLADTLQAGFERATDILHSGQALQMLQNLRECVKNV